MGDLAAALELLHLAVTRVRSLTATLVEWYDEERMSLAFDRYDEGHRGGGGGFVGVLRDSHGEPSFRQYEQRTLVQFSAPTRYRLIQRANDYAHRPHDVLVIADGRREWTYNAAERDAYVQVSDHHEIFDLIDPAWLSGAWALTVVGRSTYEGREALELEATPRSTRVAWHVRLNAGGLADRLVAVIDSETGLLLSLASYFQGAPFEIKRLVDVTIDPPLDDDMFVFTPPSGVEVHDLNAAPEHPPWRIRLQARYHLWRLRRRVRRGRA